MLCFLSVAVLGVFLGAVASSPLSVLDYSEELAIKAAYLSSAAYELDPSCSSWDFPNSKCKDVLPGFEAVTSFGTGRGLATNAFAYVGVQHGGEDWGADAGGAIVVAFKGTGGESLGDFVADLSTLLRYNNPCIVGHYTDDDNNVVNLGLIHFGFCEYYKQLDYLGLGKAIADLAQQYPTYRVLLTGHSLGAAAATVAAADMGRRFKISSDRLVLIPLGSPRVGDGDFAEMLRSTVGSIFRVVHHRDIVTHLPPCCSSWLGACSARPTCPTHPAVEVYYDDGMLTGDSFTVCSQTQGEDASCGDTLIFDLDVQDHYYYFDVVVRGFCGMKDEQIAAGFASQSLADNAPSMLAKAGLGREEEGSKQERIERTIQTSLEEEEKVARVRTVLQQKEKLSQWWNAGV